MYRSRSNIIFKNNDNKPFNNYNYKKRNEWREENDIENILKSNNIFHYHSIK